ncbi:hypothetical protein PRUPE_2G109400, partial [Prunus persica]
MKKITLKSDDGETFEVEEAVAMQSQTIKHMVEDDCANEKVIEYCKKHHEEDVNGENKVDIKNWDTGFMKVDQSTLFDLILAANYLKIKSLLDLTCQTVADMINGKTPEAIRETFNIKNDITSKKEEESNKENQWPF